MAEVIGTIGIEQVVLNNAATETTLKALLLATAGSQEKMERLLAMAGKAGLDNKAIEEANKAIAEEARVVRQLTEDELKLSDQIKEREQKVINRFQKLDQTIVSLMDGTASASGIFKTLGQELPGVIGMVVSGMGRLIAIQEQNFQSYQQLTQNGISFGGSLTMMRQAAANAYVTLDQFQNILKNNSQMLAMLGGTADQGATSFAIMSGELIKSDAGRHLQQLGFTTDEVAGGMANYLASSGGRNAQEMKNTKAITDASAQYMEQLDGLSRITGESRQQLQEQTKAAAANAAFQAKMATMSEAEKAKMTAGLTNAMAAGGKGAQDAYMSKILGIPPISQEARLFTATMGEANNAIMKSADVAMDSSKTMADLNETFFDAATGIQVDVSKFSEEQKAALIAQGGPLGQAIQAAQASANKFGKQTDEQRREALAKQQRESTEAARMSDAMRSLKELGAQLWEVFSPLLTAVSYLAMGFGLLVNVISFTVGLFNKIFDALGPVGPLFKGLAVVIGLLVAAKRLELAQLRIGMKPADLLASMGGKVGGLFGGGNTTTASPTGALAGATGGTAGGGIGGAISGILSSLSEGLKKLGNPQVMLGAVTLGLLAGTLLIAGKGLENFANITWEGMAKGFVTLLGLGALAAVLSFAAPFIIGGALAIGALGLAMIPFGIAVALAGPQMQNLAKGLIMLGDVNPLSLMAVGSGILSLSGAMVALSVGAGIAGLTAGSFTQIVNGLDKLNNMDPARLLAISKSMKDIGANIQDIGGGGILGKVGGLASSIFGKSDKVDSGTPVVASNESGNSGQASSAESLTRQLETLNSTMQELLSYNKETAENTKRTHEATRDLSGDLFA